MENAVSGPPVADLRDLARQIEKVAQEHFCYGQVNTIIQNAVDHICAIARVEELNRAEARRTIPDPELPL